MNPDLGAVRAFVAVADCASFAYAAQRLGLTAFTVSRRAAALERQLQVRLPTRATRGMAFTEAVECLPRR